ncbi:hypothetical protein [Microcoleus sp. CAWBG58]|nr:hypothetical protein [Microcoleus sp. CAWBG58]
MIHSSNPLLSTAMGSCQLSTVNCQLSTVNCQLITRTIKFLCFDN